MIGGFTKTDQDCRLPAQQNSKLKTLPSATTTASTLWDAVFSSFPSSSFMGSGSGRCRPDPLPCRQLSTRASVSLPTYMVLGKFSVGTEYMVLSTLPTSIRTWSLISTEKHRVGDKVVSASTRRSDCSLAAPHAFSRPRSRPRSHPHARFLSFTLPLSRSPNLSLSPLCLSHQSMFYALPDSSPSTRLA